MTLLPPTAIVYVGHVMTDGYRRKLEEAATHLGVKLYICMNGLANKRFKKSWEHKVETENNLAHSKSKQSSNVDGERGENIENNQDDDDDEDDDDDDEDDDEDDDDDVEVDPNRATMFPRRKTSKRRFRSYEDMSLRRSIL